MLNNVATFHFVNATWIFANSFLTARKCTSTWFLTLRLTFATAKHRLDMYWVKNCQIMLMQSSTIVFNFHWNHEPHCHPVFHPSDNNSSTTEAYSKSGCIDPEQPPVWTRIDATPHKDNILASKPKSNEYFDLFNDEIDRLLSFLCEKEYLVANWRGKHNRRKAAIHELFRNCTMANISNFTSSQPLFQRLDKMSYTMGIN